MQFHDLGLLIVDEEQRFGVTHKEKLKELSRGVDVLTLSAMRCMTSLSPSSPIFPWATPTSTSGKAFLMRAAHCSMLSTRLCR